MYILKLHRRTVPLCTSKNRPPVYFECYPIGVLKMIDEGLSDEKIIAVCKTDPFYNTYKDVSELPKHLFDEIKHFYELFKSLEYKETVVEKIEGREEAIKVILKSLERYSEVFE